MPGRWVDDPNGVNPPQWVEGYDPAMGQQSEGPGVHTSKKRLLWEQGRNFLVPAGVMGADALLAAVNAAGTTAAAGAAPSAVAGGASAGGVGAGTAATTGAAATGGVGAGAGTTAAAGGGLASLPKILDYAGRGIGAVAASQTHNRDVDNYNTQNQDQDQLARAVLDSNNIERDLAQRIYLNNDYQRQAHNSVYGGLLRGAEDVNITGLPEGVTMGNITGGARPSAFTGREQIGAALQKNAAPTLQNPPGLDSLPKIPNAPPITPLQGASGTERALGYGSAALPIIAALFGSGSQPTAPRNLAMNVGTQLLPTILDQQTRQPLPTAPPVYNGNGMGGASFINPNTGRRF